MICMYKEEHSITAVSAAFAKKIVKPLFIFSVGTEKIQIFERIL